VDVAVAVAVAVAAAVAVAVDTGMKWIQMDTNEYRMI
jgi:hypothetical protein